MPTPKQSRIDRTVSIAPMMDWTDRHDRYFLRLISRHALLYSEMVTTGAVLHGDRTRLLGFDPAEHPLALQLGGSEPDALARSAAIGEDVGYDEINLNVGCPSDRVQSGRFGACLMAEPDLVARCTRAMIRATSLPVTVKSRIGVDDQDSFDALKRFIGTVSEIGVTTFIVHARKAWLNGLSPKENREVPPLRYDIVYRIKQEFPELEIIVNGGIRRLEEIDRHLEHVDGVMIGREAYQNPYFLAAIDARYFGAGDTAPDRRRIVEELVPYIDRELAAGVPLRAITRHILGLYQGERGARSWRRHLSENAHRDSAKSRIVRDAAALTDVRRPRPTPHDTRQTDQ